MKGFSLPTRFPRASRDVVALNPHLTTGQIENAGSATQDAMPRKPAGRVPNKTEALYHRLYLAARIDAGGIVKCEYEALTLRLAHDTRYTPDWVCWLPSGEIELHEVKGAKVWDDALVKAKVAAAMFPHRLVLARKNKGVWLVVDVPGWWTSGRVTP